MNKNQIDALILIIGRFIYMLVSVLSIRILTSVLAPVEIGRMTIFLTIIGFFGLFMINPIGMYINRQIIGWRERGSLWQNLLFYIFFVFMTGMLAIMLLSIIRIFIPIDQKISNLWFVSITFSGIFVSSSYASLLSYINFFKKRLTFVFLSNLSTIAALLFSALLTLFFAKTAELWLTGQFLSQFIFFGISLLILFHISHTAEVPDGPGVDFSFKKIKGALHFSLPLSLAVFCYWVQSQGYRFILQYKFGLETLGIFFVTFNVGAQLMLAFEAMFNQFYHPIFYGEIASDDRSKRAEAWNAFAAAFLPALVITLFFIGSSGSLLIKFISAPAYWPFSYLMFYGALVEGLRIFYSTYSLAAHAEYKTKSLLLPGLMAALTTLILVYYLPNWNMYIGIASALVLAALIGLSVLRIEIKQIMPVEFPTYRIVKAFLFGSLMFAFLGAAFLFNLHGYYWNLIVIFIMASYFMLGQYLLARSWLKRSL